jgi:hypothetical protein
VLGLRSRNWCDRLVIMANGEGSPSRGKAAITAVPNFSPRRNPRSLSRNLPSTPTSIPKHPHSLQSSPGHLSLHDYRKLQSSPEVVPSSVAPRTLKRKGKASDLTVKTIVPNAKGHSSTATSQLTPSPTPRAQSEFFGSQDLDLTVVSASE